MSNDLKEKSINSFIWKTAQSVFSLGTTFVIQLVLARMLDPEAFGIIAITTVFMTLANTIIETSFSSSVIQRMQLEQKLTSSIFYANLLLAAAVYVGLFAFAPLVSAFYKEPILTAILRVQGLRIIFSGFYSIPQALLNRRMRFKSIFFCYLIGSIGQAAVGFTMAWMGMGVWALVVSTLVGNVLTGISMILMEPWKPSFYFSFGLVREALAYSSNILAIRVIRKIFYNIRVLAIGRVYDAEVLGLFNKGFQFPSTAMTVVDGSLTSVAFTSLSKLQDDRERLVQSLRQYVRIIMFVCTPMMVGMAMVAKPMVIVLLTEKWVECVPFLQIIAFTQIFVPLNIKTTAFEALGESRLSMKIHVSSIVISLLLLAASIPFSAHVMTLSGLVSNIFLHIVLTVITSRRLDYTIREQVRDACCAFLPTLVMAAAVYGTGRIPCGLLAGLCAQITVGGAVFVLTAFLTRNPVFFALLRIVKAKLLRKK